MGSPHGQGHLRVTQAVCENPDILVCKSAMSEAEADAILMPWSSLGIGTGK